MPITINGTGTIAGITAGGLPDGVITTDDLAANAVTTPKLGTNEASGLAKAWVNFNGTGTVAIRAQYNVSSITDNGTGDYTVNFTSALADANYSVAVTQGGSASGAGASTADQITARTASLVRVYTYTTAGGLIDVTQVNVSIFR
jgi:hypothetical protein